MKYIEYFKYFKYFLVLIFWCGNFLTASSQQTTGGNSQRDSRDLVAYDEDVDLNYD